ncbi:MAG: sodium:solute symporter family protein [Elusimicrobiota bacterium]
MPFAPIDWALILGYLALAFVAGVVMSRAASRGMNSYFLADRTLPWWWLGTSMVATTFAADTPLAVTGMVAKYGIAGNWFWWSWALLYVAVTVFFAGRWRRSEVLTDAELIELRYEGRPAAFLRAFKACFLALVINCIVLGWVFRAMSKIADPFLSWKSLLGADTYAALTSAWPSWLIFDNPNNTITVLIIFALTVAYSSMGGIRGVILTDLIQFTMAMAGSILFAAYAVSHVGGVSSLIESLHAQYPNADEILSFMPSMGAVWLPFHIFLIYMLVQWWAQQSSDGSGYLAQRMMAARTPREATKGALWFTAANFAVRTWPWVIIGLVSLTLFPKGSETAFFAEGAKVAGDREMAYPVLMKLLLPPGVLGMLFASLLAAFMSTVDTHLNWGTSYLVNDIYRRFVRPRASQKELIMVSRFSLVGLAIIAILVASQISSIEKAWKFCIALGAGIGLPAILRWLWWRVNAWTEIAGMISAILAAVVLYSLYPEIKDEYMLLWTVAISTACALAATLLTAPVGRERLESFCRKVRPVGWWGPVREGHEPMRGFARLAGAWVIGTLGVYGLMFGIGHILLTSKLLGTAMVALSGGALYATLRLTDADTA